MHHNTTGTEMGGGERSVEGNGEPMARYPHQIVTGHNELTSSTWTTTLYTLTNNYT